MLGFGTAGQCIAAVVPVHRCEGVAIQKRAPPACQTQSSVLALKARCAGGRRCRDIFWNHISNIESQQALQWPTYADMPVSHTCNHQFVPARRWMQQPSQCMHRSWTLRGKC